MKSPLSTPYTEKRLKNYALWYYERYLPSRARLTEKLLEKSKQNIKIVETILEEIKDIFIEESLLEAKIRFLIESHKNEKIIRFTLLKKGFEWEKIDEKLQLYHEELRSWESHKIAIEKRYSDLEKRWKSQKQILLTLGVKFPQFKEQILSLKRDDSESLKKQYEKLYSTTRPTTKNDFQKIASKLAQKWFRFDDIKKVLEESQK